MDQLIFPKIKLLVLYSALLFLAVNVVEAQTTKERNFEEKPILGIIVPGETTVADFAETLNKRGCEFTVDSAAMNAKRMLTVKEGCFDLPGNPVVVVSGQTVSALSPIDAMWMNFRKDELGSSYDTYLQSLTKAYGSPFILQSPPQGRREALWTVPQKPPLVILMDERGSDGKSSVLYMIGNAALSFLKERGIELNPRAHWDLGTL